MRQSVDINDMFDSALAYPLSNLDKNNQWVRMADNLPWDEIERMYLKRLNNHRLGAPNKPAQMVIGAMIVKHMKGLSDKATIEEIQENPYLQYLCGLRYFTTKPLFCSELFVSIRARLDEEFMNQLTLILQKAAKGKKVHFPHNEDDNNQSQDSNSDAASTHPKDQASSSSDLKHAGVMKIDATCTPAEVRYPTDINLLEDGSRLINRVIEKISKATGNKPLDTNRKKTRECFVYYTKKKHKGKRLRKSTKRQMIHYLSEDLKSFLNWMAMMHSTAIDVLTRYEVQTLKATFEMLRQQQEMFSKNLSHCANRIISIFQPHIRPIVRGKAARKVEFGAKIGVCLCGGYAYIDHLSWDAYNESTDLRTHLENYKARFGCYPKEVQADKIYLNRDNRDILKSLRIECHCAPLGRPPHRTDPDKLERRRRASCERNEIEGSFGLIKRRYRADNIRAKLKETSPTWIGMCLFVRNLKKFLGELFFALSKMRLFGWFLAIFTSEFQLCPQPVLKYENLVICRKGLN